MNHELEPRAVAGIEGLETGQQKDSVTLLGSSGTVKPIDRIRAVLDIKNGMAHCPAHEDKNRSLSITEGDDGRVLLYCHAGCSTEDIVRALGLTMSDLFPSNGKKKHEIGRRQHLYDGCRKTIISFSDGSKTAFWEHYENDTWIRGLNGNKQTLYNSGALKSPGIKCLSESEKDADQVNLLGFPCLAWGGAENWKPYYADKLAGQEAALFTHNDDAGRRSVLKAAQDLTEKGCTVRIIPGDTWGPHKGADVADWLQAGHTREELEQIIQSTPIWTPGDDELELDQSNDSWPELVPLDGYSAPEIPENILPGWAGHFAKEASRAIQVPYPMVLASTLGVVSLAVTNAVRHIHVSQGYSESPNLYLFAPLPSGERKTAVVGECTKPLREWESEQAELKRDAIKAGYSRRKTHEKIIEAMRAKAAKTSDDTKRKELIEAIAAQEVALEDIPSIPRLLGEDATPESLPKILQIQEERLGIISSEGGIFDIFGGRYSNGIPNLDLILKAKDGEPYRVDRVGREPIMLENPLMVVCICPQPEVLQSIASKPGFRGRGLLARNLYFISDSMVGYRDVSPNPIPDSIKREYSLRIKSLLDMRGANLELTISQAARRPFLEFAQMVEDQMQQGGEFEHFRDWAGKLPGQAARIAGIFHCIEARLPGELVVSEDTMRKALSLAAILADHAKVAFSIMGSDPATEAAKHILDWIKRKGPIKFTLRDCYRDLAGRYKTISEIKPGLSVLVERGYLMDLGMEQKEGKGRPRGPFYSVNPIIIGGDR